MIHYFNKTDPLRPYLYSVPANRGEGFLFPKDALKDAPERIDGFWPCEQDGQWVQVEDHRGKEGWLDGEPFTIQELGPLPEGWSDIEPVIEKSFAELKQEKLREILTTYEFTRANLLNQVYPPGERETWVDQISEAEAYLAWNGEDEVTRPFTPYLNAMIAQRGDTHKELAEAIVGRAALWKPLDGNLLGQQQRQFAEVSALQTSKEVKAYEVQYIISADAYLYLGLPMPTMPVQEVENGN